jgi:hypothetical protein
VQTDAGLGMNRVITAQSDPDATRAYWTMSRGNTERAFLAARRHSRVVRILRIAVPAAVSFTLVVVVLVTYLNPLRMLAKLLRADGRYRGARHDETRHRRIAQHPR